MIKKGVLAATFVTLVDTLSKQNERNQKLRNKTHKHKVQEAKMVSQVKRASNVTISRS